MSGLTFDAFALPPALGRRAPAGEAVLPGAPELALSAYDEPGARVRYVEASAGWIAGVADGVRATRDRLGARRAGSITSSLGAAGARFLDPTDPLRGEALALLPATCGLSPEMCGVVLDGMARDWTEERLGALVRAELGDARVLDGFGASAAAARDPTRRGDGPDSGPSLRTMAVGPSLCVQVVAGSVPGVGVTALVRSLLLKGPTLLKPGRGDVVLPVLFARALRDADPELADALAVVYWPGGRRDLEDAALARADVVTAYGSDETVEELRARTPVTARFVAYHHRVSVGVVGREALAGGALDAAAAAVAEAVALFDRRGCVSPQVLYVEAGDDGPSRFARALATALGGLEDRLPSGELDPAEASALQQLRGTAELMAAAGEAEVVHGGASPWTVVLESGGEPLGSCAGRTVRVRAVGDAADVARLLAPLAPHLQTVGVAGLGERLEETARALGRVGASRVVPFSSVAFPAPWWHHDGRGPLLDLVRWVDLEEE